MVRENSKNQGNAKSVKVGKWCIICGARLAGNVCPKHGQMVAFLPFDPLAAAAVAVHCDRIGLVDVEADF